MRLKTTIAMQACNYLNQHNNHRCRVETLRVQHPTLQGMGEKVPVDPVYRSYYFQ